MIDATDPAPAPAAAPASPAAPPPASEKKVINTWRWRQWAIMGAGPIIVALLAWQLHSLDPRYWCNVANEASFDRTSALQKLSACLGIQQTILTIKDHAIIGLLGTLSAIIALFMVAEFRTRLSLSGPMGTKLDVGGDTSSSGNEGQ